MSGYNTNLSYSDTQVIDGDSGTTYLLYLHVQAAVELHSYTGGTYDSYLQIGGTPSADTNTVVKLQTSDPVATYYLNRAAASTDYSVPLDYYVGIPIKGGATFTLTVTRGDHILHLEDFGGGDVKTGLATYDGEFVQIDFVNTLEDDVVERRAGLGSCREWLFSGYEEDIVNFPNDK